MEKSSKNEYLSIREIADIMGCSWNFVRERIVPNVIHVKIGCKIMVRKEAFHQYLRKLERGA